MSLPLLQHQVEIQRNRRAWEAKPLLRELYAGFYRRILARVDPRLPGRVVEVGSGMGNLREHLPGALCTDLFANPWLDLVCDAYDLPFADRSVSHLILFDVFHHLRAPRAFLKAARRVLAPEGRLLVFDPFISLASFPVYGLFHHEPVGWWQPISGAESLPRPRDYYAAQGNATRLFFAQGGMLHGNLEAVRCEPVEGLAPPTQLPRIARPAETAGSAAGGGGGADWLEGWEVIHREAFASFSYLLSGGFSRRAFYPAAWLPRIRAIDGWLSRWPRVFGGRCLVVLRASDQ